MFSVYGPSVYGPFGPLAPVPSAVAVLTAQDRPDASIGDTLQFLQQVDKK